jgi:hypothetical protein
MKEIEALKRIAASGDKNDIYEAYLRDKRNGAYGADRADYQRLMDDLEKGAAPDETEMEFALAWAEELKKED